MSGMYNGVQAIIRERCSVAYYVPCTAHSGNLVGKCVTEGGPATFGLILSSSKSLCMSGLLQLPIDGRYTEII